MKIKSGFLGFVFGGLLGAAFALLYAPQSGEETRKILIENSQKAKQDALDSIENAQDSALAKLYEVQSQIEVFNREAKEILAQLQEVGKTTAAEQKFTLEKGYEEAKEVVSA